MIDIFKDVDKIGTVYHINNNDLITLKDSINEYIHLIDDKKLNGIIDLSEREDSIIDKIMNLNIPAKLKTALFRELSMITRCYN